MDKHSISLYDFFNNYSEEIKDSDCDTKSFNTLDKYPLLPSQAIYVVDWKVMKIVFQRGIEKLLGYSEEEFDFELISEFYHPDDIERYIKLVKLTNEWARKINPEPFSIQTTIDYRIRKKDGTYLKVMRQSTIFENCIDRSIKSAFSIISDISRIKLNTSINLSVIDNNTGEVILEDIDNLNEFNQFTAREKEILLKLKTGLNSKAIAKEFNISSHTIDTHRRKMLAKSKCKNVVEMVQFAEKRGLI